MARVWFRGGSMLKSNPEMAVEIPEQFFLVQKFTAVSSAQ
jgi:hypothetical protein